MTTTSTTNFLQVEISSEASSVHTTRVSNRRVTKVPPASALELLPQTPPISKASQQRHYSRTPSSTSTTATSLFGSGWTAATKRINHIRTRETSPLRVATPAESDSSSSSSPFKFTRLSRALDRWRTNAPNKVKNRMKSEERWVWVEVRPVIRERIIFEI